MRNIMLTILIVLATVFTIQNMHPIDLVFIVWSIKTVTAFAIAVALTLGVLIGALLVLPAVMRSKRIANQSKQQIATLEHALGHQNQPIATEADLTEKPKL
ncbi:MAG: LapA family protein [Methylotenera sp.]|nr:LapA family protein [Methylotenera sp.]